jgi:hypothetical protein
MQAVSPGAASNRLKIMLRFIRQQNDRNNVADLKIDSRAQFVQNVRERGGNRDHFKNAVFSLQVGLVLARPLPKQRELS